MVSVLSVWETLASVLDWSMRCNSMSWPGFPLHLQMRISCFHLGLPKRRGSAIESPVFNASLEHLLLLPDPVGTPASLPRQRSQSPLVVITLNPVWTTKGGEAHSTLGCLAVASRSSALSRLVFEVTDGLLADFRHVPTDDRGTTDELAYRPWLMPTSVSSANDNHDLGQQPKRVTSANVVRPTVSNVVDILDAVCLSVTAVCLIGYRRGAECLLGNLRPYKFTLDEIEKRRMIHERGI